MTHLLLTSTIHRISQRETSNKRKINKRVPTIMIMRINKRVSAMTTIMTIMRGTIILCITMSALMMLTHTLTRMYKMQTMIEPICSKMMKACMKRGMMTRMRNPRHFITSLISTSFGNHTLASS